ncbi:hypothetical protein RRF57_000536 [Xylaria bambusicola]|uniref:Uncharacterized protein n=1 Tax=Xylaria bambusicola TaxID=326684 RepID=A0AAN7U400_9PEZI
MPPVKSEIMKLGLSVAVAQGITASPASENRVNDITMAVTAGKMAAKIMATVLCSRNDGSGGGGNRGEMDSAGGNGYCTVF